VWQWLPTTPIGPGNSPYQSSSAFAGSPLMVALEPLVQQGWLTRPVLPGGGFAAQRVDFGRVVPWRLRQLRLAAGGFCERATPQQQADLQAWCAAQADWLDDYALFMALEVAHHGQPWWHWHTDLRQRRPQALAAALQVHAREVFFWKFVQWCFDTQAVALKTYANSHGVSIMGDLPIFIAHHSADCWARPDLYFLDHAFQPTVVAGCPPDSMAPEGQRWGNPLYRWDRMAAEDFGWWIARMRRALHLADVLRIDHFRGFAGYYEIPASCPNATQGRWVSGPGRAVFEAMQRALGVVPIVAEDLGLITPDVVQLRADCGFPGMKVLQFAFDGDASSEFLPHNFGSDCVAYTGTHDNNTTRGWWQAASPQEQVFAGNYLGCAAHDVHHAMLRAVCNSVADLAMFPLQDVLGLDGAHRMNTPGSVGGSNWTWRCEDKLLDSDAARRLGQMTAASGRGPLALLHPLR
jgi:4-alpha-glucanotransferase